MKFVAAFFGQWQADQSPGVAGHEVDDVRSNLFGSADQVAFMLAIFVVDDNNHPPFANVGSCSFDGGKRHFLNRFSLECGDLSPLFVVGYWLRRDLADSKDQSGDRSRHSKTLDSLAPMLTQMTARR